MFESVFVFLNKMWKPIFLSDLF